MLPQLDLERLSTDRRANNSPATAPRHADSTDDLVDLDVASAACYE